jgi:CubicO group peptidase (beta-lactamase class C family)
MKNSTSRIHLRAFVLLTLMMTAFFSQEAVAQKKQKRVEKKGSYANASYSRTEASSFMRTWWIAGPMFVSSTPNPDGQFQEEAFKKDIISQVEVVAGKPFPAVHYQNADVVWKLNTSTDDVTDLDALHNKADFAFAYALAEIQSDSAKRTFLAVGSDDGIKVWHNGKLVHDNWVGRGVVPDQDIVSIDLIKGSNQILIKVQDWAGGWGFTARLLGKKDYTEKLIDGARRGDIDQVNLFLAAGADVNGKGLTGLTALDVAKISGRDEVAELLKKKGATENKVPSGEVLVDQIYQPFPDKLSSGVAVLISKDGKIIYKKGFGYSDIPAKKPVTTITKFRIGSITKQFTASGILKLQEEGKLSVTDKLSKYFPDFPRGNEVTIHHLLTHTSGIHSYTGKSDFIERVVKPVTNEELLTYFIKDEYDFNPGERYQYNNSGYFLLGYIIEKVSGKSYGQYLKETFFVPLQMNNTGVHTSTLKLDNEAKGYTKENGAYKLSPNWDMSWAGGAGALYSTVEDLFTWNEAVFNGKVLTKPSIEAAFTPVLLNNGKIPDGTRYGYGWGLDSYRGEEMIGHSGGLHGFISQLARYPEDNMTVVILTNISPPEAHLNPNLIAECFLWEKMDKQKSFVAQTNDNVNVKIYEGRYDFKNGAVMTITSEGNNLFAQLSGQQKFPIFPSGPDEYFWKVVEARIKFEKNEKGEVSLGHFEQGTYKVDVVKIPDVAIVKLDPVVYKGYTGKYDYGDNLIITVSEEQGRIFAQATNQPKFEIFPTSEKEFVVKEINAKVTFVKETDGKISKMIVDMAGQKKDAPKVE